MLSREGTSTSGRKEWAHGERDGQAVSPPQLPCSHHAGASAL